jgi:hypothetical protein
MIRSFVENEPLSDKEEKSQMFNQPYRFWRSKRSILTIQERNQANSMRPRKLKSTVYSGGIYGRKYCVRSSHKEQTSLEAAFYVLSNGVRRMTWRSRFSRLILSVKATVTRNVTFSSIPQQRLSIPLLDLLHVSPDYLIIIK